MDTDNNNSTSPFDVLANIYLNQSKDKKLVIGYWIQSINGNDYQFELWDIDDRLLVYRHSSSTSAKTLEYIQREQIESAIEMIEDELRLYTPKCLNYSQFLKREDLF